MSFQEEWIAEKAGDPRPNEELVRLLGTIPRDGDEGNDIYTILQARRDPILIRQAQEMCKGADVLDRRIGSGILCQNGAGDYKILREECVETLLTLIPHEDDIEVLCNACGGLSNYEDPRISPSLARLSLHLNPRVRYAVAWSLGGREDTDAVDTLIRLSADIDSDVRNWATFGLAQLTDLDNPTIREALFQRVEDESSEVRAEALLGLSRREDERVIAPLIRELKAIAEADDYWDLAFEAAAEIGDSGLFSELDDLREDGIENEYLKRAIASCRIPDLSETGDQPDGAATSCPVCGLNNAFPDQHGFCTRCGWQASVEQLENPDLTNSWNRRSLNQERERWRKRLEAAGQDST